jgi:hypothetical protein
MSPLERRYRRLLRAYPADYRSGRGDEMLGTLLDTAAPGQRRPSARESTALIFGGIRARTAKTASQSASASLHLAAMLALATYISVDLVLMANPHLASFSTPNEWGTYAGLFVATLLIWFVRRELAALALVAALAALFSLKTGPPLLVWAVPCLAVLTALRPERLPKAWLAWFCLPVVLWLVFMLRLLNRSLFMSTGMLYLQLIWVLLGLFVLVPLIWAVTDARPAFALAILFAGFGLANVEGGSVGVTTGFRYLALSAVAALPLLVRLVWRRRRAVV